MSEDAHRSGSDDVLATQERLRNSTDGERWAWLVGRLHEGDKVIDGLLQAQAQQRGELDIIHGRCAGRRWQGWALKGLLPAIGAYVATRLCGWKP